MHLKLSKRTGSMRQVGNILGKPSDLNDSMPALVYRKAVCKEGNYMDITPAQRDENVPKPHRGNVAVPLIPPAHDNAIVNRICKNHSDGTHNSDGYPSVRAYYRRMDCIPVPYKRKGYKNFKHSKFFIFHYRVLEVQH